MKSALDSSQGDRRSVRIILKDSGVKKGTVPFPDFPSLSSPASNTNWCKIPLMW